MTTTFSILIWINKSKLNRKNQAPIYGRITVNGKRAEIALKYFIEPEKWNSNTGYATGNKEEIKIINSAVADFRTKIQRIFNKLMEAESPFSVDDIKNNYLGVNVQNNTLLNLLSKHIQELELRVENNDYAPATIVKYRTTYKHLSEFILTKYSKKDFFLKDLKFQFISDFELFLRINKKNTSNSLAKHIKHLKKIVKIAQSGEMLANNPFLNYTIKGEKTNREYLTSDELDLLINKEYNLKSASVNLIKVEKSVKLML